MVSIGCCVSPSLVICLQTFFITWRLPGLTLKRMPYAEIPSILYKPSMFLTKSVGVGARISRTTQPGITGLVSEALVDAYTWLAAATAKKTVDVWENVITSPSNLFVRWKMCRNFFLESAILLVSNIHFVENILDHVCAVILMYHKFANGSLNLAGRSWRMAIATLEWVDYLIRGWMVPKHYCWRLWPTWKLTVFRSAYVSTPSCLPKYKT